MHGTHPLSAVHSRDLDDLLAKLGITRLKLNEMLCYECRSAITPFNLGALAYRRGQIVAVCDTPACIHRIVTGDAQAG